MDHTLARRSGAGTSRSPCRVNAPDPTPCGVRPCLLHPCGVRPCGVCRCRGVHMRVVSMQRCAHAGCVDAEVCTCGLALESKKGGRGPSLGPEQACWIVHPGKPNCRPPDLFPVAVPVRTCRAALVLPSICQPGQHLPACTSICQPVQASLADVAHQCPIIKSPKFLALEDKNAYYRYSTEDQHHAPIIHAPIPRVGSTRILCI
eukprot:365772-Chlamydomonas_euryale.AAC.6